MAGTGFSTSHLAIPYAELRIKAGRKNPASSRDVEGTQTASSPSFGREKENMMLRKEV